MRLFRRFDIDGSGTIEATELKMLGNMRRTLGHRVETWTDEKNETLIARRVLSAYSCYAIYHLCVMT